LSQYILGKRAQSSILKATAKNMAGDVLISLGVLVGISLSIIFNMPIFDPIVAMLVGLWVIKSGINIFIETNMELMDGNADTDIYKTVFEAVNSVHGAINPHRTRMRRIAGFWDIDIDIEVEPHLTIEEAHKIASAVERAIKMKVENIYDIMVHIEPKGDKDNDPHEGYGLSAHELIKDGR
jgi:cation diffusion facilitator family transporter